ncbi:hypothetical protein OG206_01035 [Streptomyces sp. NBC_01341]|nr:hypothetical protein OG206_01035 [Streptomyces sp. NBC_01341]
MEGQVHLAAGSLAGDTCGVAAGVAGLPHNQPRTSDFQAVFRALQD